VLDGYDVIRVSTCMIHVHAVLCAFGKIVCNVSRPISSQGLANVEHDSAHEHNTSTQTWSDEHVHDHDT